MQKEEMQKLLQAQKEFFRSGATLPLEFRRAALKKLYAALETNEAQLIAALKEDLGKSSTESYMCEIGMTKAEISFLLKNLKKLAKPKKAKMPMAQYPSKGTVTPRPYGNTLIISPWNYPLLLTLEPLCDAIAAGNTAIVKPSAYSPATARAVADLIAHCFDPAHVSVVTGGRAENTALLELKFDYIFFTGSQAVGKEVMRRAAEHLTPVTLELGGKSPCIVTKSADLALAARRIVFGKYLNCGQTCVAPDFLYCDASIKDELMAELAKQITAQFGKEPLANGDYGKLINEKHFVRVCSLIDPAKVVVGGVSEPDTLRIAPTVMARVTFDDAVMQEEIFGPVLPILTYETLEEAVERLQTMPKPLALYLFTSQKKEVTFVHERVRFGGGCVNDTIIHLATATLPFGGVGESGMGNYHGKYGFETFSHLQSILSKKTWLDLPMRYQPYSAEKEKTIRRFEK